MKVSVPEGTKGDWSVERFTVEDRYAGFYRDALAGRMIEPGEYTRLLRGGVCVMSDTPAEQNDHFWFIKKAKGHVLINGLGLGMCVGALLDRDDVESITVVEIDQNVIDLVGPHYDHPKVTIQRADALLFKPTVGVRYGAVWHDIWDNICSDNLHEMVTLHRRYGKRSDWQGSWCRESCERQRDQSNREAMRWRA